MITCAADIDTFSGLELPQSDSPASAFALAPPFAAADSVRVTLVTTRYFDLAEAIIPHLAATAAGGWGAAALVLIVLSAPLLPCARTVVPVIV